MLLRDKAPYFLTGFRLTDFTLVKAAFNGTEHAIICPIKHKHIIIVTMAVVIDHRWPGMQHIAMDGGTYIGTETIAIFIFKIVLTTDPVD